MWSEVENLLEASETGLEPSDSCITDDPRLCDLVGQAVSERAPPWAVIVGFTETEGFVGMADAPVLPPGPMRSEPS